MKRTTPVRMTRVRTMLLLAALAASLQTCVQAAAQGGGGGAGAGAGAGATGSPGTAGARGAATGQAGGQAGANGQTGAQTGPQTGPQTAGTAQSPAAAYAAGASLGPDPRTPPKARPGAYTMQQIIALAEARNPTLLAAQANLRSVRAQEIQAGLRVNPYLTIYGNSVTESQDAINPDSYSVQVSRLFERGQKRRFRLEAARATTGQTQAQLEDTVRQTVLTIRQAFTKMLIGKEALELSTASLKDFQHEVDISKERYQAGDLGRLDYERLDLQLGSFESDAANDEITLLQASDQLQTLIGMDAVNDQFDILGNVVPPTVTPTRPELLQQAIANRPDYAAARLAVDAANANAQLAISNGTTDPTLEAEYDRNGTENTAGFTFTVPLRIFDRNQGNKETTRFQAEASRFSATAARNQVVSDVEQAWVGYTRAKTLSVRFSDHYLDESKDVLGIAQFAFEHGGLALIDYLDALRDARTATSDALNAFANTWNAIHQLSAASATDLEP